RAPRDRESGGKRGSRRDRPRRRRAWYSLGRRPPAFSAAGHLRDLGREVVRLLLDALAALEAHEALELDVAARFLRGLRAHLVDGGAWHDDRFLLEQADLGVPLVELALDDLGPRLLGLGLRLFAQLGRVDL